METTTLSLGACTFDLLTDGGRVLGLGAIRIGDLAVRSGRLPISVYTQSYSGVELDFLALLGIEQGPDEIRIRMTAYFRPMMIKPMRDHSFDPIHDTADWQECGVQATGLLDLVLRPAMESIGEREFRGFSYHYEYHSETVPLFWLLDRASWELDGDITGATVFNQSSCSDPVVTFAAETAWTTEGVIHWADENSKANPVMTHNLPRWASHQAFDFQCKGDTTLLGIYARVDLIRSLLKRDAGHAELKTFDKHIFDETLQYATAPKQIVVNTAPKTLVDQQNLWTWTFDEVANRARAEFGLAEEPVTPRLGWNYWVNWTIDSYYKDLLPAAQAIGIKALFIDNINRSDYSEYNGYPDGWCNMCGGHEYEPGAKMGGATALKRLVDDCRELGIMPYSWTNNDQSMASPLYQRRDWFVKMEDTRLSYGGAYTNGLGIWSFAEEAPRRYWIDCLKKSRQETGLAGYLFDSFYNLGFMPVDYRDCTPRTHWRQILAAFKELQEADVHFMIESFGPFGEVQHGCPRSYNLDNLFACYKVGMGTGYTTVPTGQDTPRSEPWPVADYYRILAHMANPGHALFYDGVRIDKLFTAEHKRVLAEYYANQPEMHRRFLQEGDTAVIWHNAEATRATIWNFATQTVALAGTVTDLTTGQSLPVAASYQLLPCHTYTVTGAPLPVKLGVAVTA